MLAYIANCTIQLGIMNVRLPEMNGPMNVSVQAGQQVVFPKDNMSFLDIEAIIAQMHRYGLYTVEEALNFKPGRQITWLINPEKPVPQNLLSDTFGLNRGVLTSQGVEMRRIAALAARKSMVDQAHTPFAADRLEMSIEEAPSAQGQTNLADLYAEGHKFTNDAPTQPARANGRVGRRARGR